MLTAPLARPRLHRCIHALCFRMAAPEAPVLRIAARDGAARAAELTLAGGVHRLVSRLPRNYCAGSSKLHFT